MQKKTITRSRSDLTIANANLRSRQKRPVKLDNFLPFLIMRTANRISRHFDRTTAWTGLTIADARTMGAVWFKPGIRLRELGDTTDIDLSTLSRLVRRLECRHLLVIEKRNRDARSGGLTLSPKGLSTIEKIAVMGLEIEATIESALTSRDIVQLKKLLRQTATSKVLSL
jgi:DNA-binding MarR family transcriptional regulator